MSWQHAPYSGLEDMKNSGFSTAFFYFPKSVMLGCEILRLWWVGLLNLFSPRKNAAGKKHVRKINNFTNQSCDIDLELPSEDLMGWSSSDFWSLASNSVWWALY